VASQNLGEERACWPRALMIDYTLTAAWASRRSGSADLCRARLAAYTLSLCLAVLAILTVINMRGVHDTGVVFMIPRICSRNSVDRDRRRRLAGAAQRGHPHRLQLCRRCPRPPLRSACGGAEGFFFRLHGHDRRGAVSNGVMAFRDDTRKNARHADHHHSSAGGAAERIAFLSRAYGIAATNPTDPDTRVCSRC